MVKIKELWEQLRDKWASMGQLLRRSIILGAISLVIVGGFIFYLVNKVEYGVLFSDLSEADAGQITADLKDSGITYKLTDGGKTISIEKSKIDEYRINLAVDNKLPDSSTGFELFDSAGMMTTDEDRKIMYQRAITGELQRSISSLKGVESAKVLLVTPDNSIFAVENKPASASVVLTLKNELPSEAVRGIVTLTAGAVENLQPENVKVVDSNGNVLSDGSQDEHNQLSTLDGKYLTMKETYEASLKRKVESILEPVYGANGVQVSINIDLNFDSIESTRTTYNNPEIRSENVQASGGGEDIERAQTGQVNDNVSNVTGDNNDKNSTYNRSVNNELDTEITKTISAPGVIERMTSSIVVNKQLARDVQEELEQLVGSAIGFNADRGDQIAVTGINFTGGAGEEGTDQPAEKEKISKNLLYIGIGGAALVVLILIVVLIVLLRRRREDDDEEEEMDEDFGRRTVNERTDAEKAFYASIAQELATDDALTDEEEAEAEAARVEEERVKEIKIIESEEEKRGKQAKLYADQHPEIAAELIKSWLKEK